MVVSSPETTTAGIAGLPAGYRRRMAGQSKRQYAVAAVVLGIIVVVLGAYLIIAGALGGDDTDEVDPQNGRVVTLLR